MANYMTETQVLEKLGIPDFRHITKDKIISFASMIQNMDPEVAKEAIKQFPNFANLALEVMRDYKTTVENLLESNKTVSGDCLTILNNIIEALKACADKDDISFDERRYYIDQMIEVGKMVSQIDKENREFNLQALIIGCIMTVFLPAIASALLGGNFRVRNIA